jgi:hypothetical protein
MRQVNTRDGIFANEGYGGGLFNLNVAFGSADEGRPGPLMARRDGSLGALGLGAIPEGCWGHKDFDACYDNCYGWAYGICDNEEANIGPGRMWPDYGSCADDYGYTCAVEDCVPGICDAPGAPAPVSWVGQPCTSRAAVRRVQGIIGAHVDGDWGPNSQTAYEAHRAFGGQRYEQLAAGCTGAGPHVEPYPGEEPGGYCLSGKNCKGEDVEQTRDDYGRCVWPDGALPGETPWMKHSTETEMHQAAINADLAAGGCELIGCDGVLGPDTCGAMRYLPNWNEGAFDCQRFSDYTCPDGGGPAPGTSCPDGQFWNGTACEPTPVPPGPCQPGQVRFPDGSCRPPDKAKGPTKAWMMIGGIALAAAAAGIYAMSKKKKK